MRWLLVSAQDDDSARAHVLPALSRCTVLVPTVQGAPDKLRYLTQASGSAMVVFTGHDALEHAAKKLGWAEGSQGVSFRAMSARDALQIASLQGTRSLIVDAAAEHALELRSDEVSMYLSRGTAEFAPDFVEPSSRGTGEYGLPPRRVSPVPAARGTGSGGGMAARVERAMAAEAAAKREPSREIRTHGARAPARDQPTQPLGNAEPSAPDEVTRKRNLAEIDDPFIGGMPRRAQPQPQPQPKPQPQAQPQVAGGQVRRVPSLNAPPLSRDMPSSPFETSRPPTLPRDDETPIVPLIAHAVAGRRVRDETIPLDDISSADAARDSAARAEREQSLRLPVAIAERFKHVEASPMERAVAAAQARPAIDLGEAVLGALADALRKFPEVEWACELADGDETTISIRVDPSYLARTEDIEDAVRMMARRSGVEVNPVIVSTPDATKDARTRGRMFFPWKKKK